LWRSALPSDCTGCEAAVALHQFAMAALPGSKSADNLMELLPEVFGPQPEEEQPPRDALALPGGSRQLVGISISFLPQLCLLESSSCPGNILLQPTNEFLSSGRSSTVRTGARVEQSQRCERVLTSRELERGVPSAGLH
jgi:hypothetical protein